MPFLSGFWGFPIINGHTGATGPTGSGAIVPFSSGITPIALATAPLNVATTSAVVAYGDSAPVAAIIGQPILDVATMSGFSFSAPTSGTITSLAADFLVTAGAAVGNTTVHAQLYKFDATGTGSFIPVGVPVNLSPTISAISVGEHLTGITAEAIPVVAGDQFTLVFYDTTDALLGVSAVTGIGSGGITI